MRNLWLAPLAVVPAAAGGYAICAVLGWASHGREMMIAAVACAAAVTLATIPMAMTRSATQIVVVQSALVASVVHLFAAILAATVIVLAKIAAIQPFLFWMLWLYGATLIVLVIGLARAIRSAPATQAPGR